MAFSINRREKVDPQPVAYVQACLLMILVEEEEVGFHDVGEGEGLVAHGLISS